MLKADKDLVIIGGGAAGLAAAQYGARANLNTLVIEELAPGGQALLIDRLENYPGYAEAKSGYEFAEAMRAQAEKFGSLFLSDTVIALRKEQGCFAIELANAGSITALAVILATGAKHKKLDTKGEKEFSGRGVSYCATCDGPFFKNKKMIVVGGGDAACDEAQFLAKLTEQVIMVHRRDRFRAQKALADRVTRNPNIEIRWNTIVEEIRGENKVGSVLLKRVDSGESYEEAADAVFIFIGSEPQTSLVPEAEKDESGSIITDQRMESSIKGLFAAGDVRATPFRQVVVAAGEGAIAAHSAAQYIDDLKGEAYR